MRRTQIWTSKYNKTDWYETKQKKIKNPSTKCRVLNTTIYIRENVTLKENKKQLKKKKKQF